MLSVARTLTAAKHREDDSARFNTVEPKEIKTSRQQVDVALARIDRSCNDKKHREIETQVCGYEKLVKLRLTLRSVGSV